MEDIIGVVALAAECALAGAIFFFLAGPVSVWLLLLFFLVVTVAAILYWHTERAPQTVPAWRNYALWSVVVGILFFLVDLAVGQVSRGGAETLPVGGGPFGILLTLLVCPFFTMICLAGLIRASFIKRTSSGQAGEQTKRNP
jgi:hypothetical protein